MSAPQALAAGSDKGLGCGEGFGPLASFLCTLSPGTNNTTAKAVGDKVNNVLSTVIGFLTIVGGIWFLFQIITAGYQWIASGGDKNNTQAAQDKVTNSVIGLVVIVLAWVIVGIIGKVMGLDLLNPGAAIQSLIIQ